MSSAAALAGEAQNFVGTWLTTVTPPAEAGAPPFTLLVTLGADGNLLASGTSGDFPALGNPCHGSWTAKGDGIEATYVCLDFDASLQQTGMDRLRARFSLDEKQQLVGKIGLTNYDISGQLVFDACCASIEGQRIAVKEPLSFESRMEERMMRRWR